MYPVIGEPPSDLGAGHSKSTWSLSQSMISGLPGGSGSSNKRKVFVTAGHLHMQNIIDTNLYIEFSDSELRAFRFVLIKSAVSTI